MTINDIERKQAKEMAKYEAAKKIREALDDAQQALGNDWDDDVEAEILEMVTEE